MSGASSFVVRTGSWQGDAAVLARYRCEAEREGVAVVALPMPGGGYRVDVHAPACPNAPPISSSRPRPDRGCTVCRSDVPAHPVSYRCVIGLLVGFKSWFVRGTMCRRCAAREFVKASALTLFAGSLSALAPVVVPIALTMNARELLVTRWLPDRWDAPSRSPSARALLGVGLALGAVAVIVAAVAAWFAPTLTGASSKTCIIVLAGVLGTLVGPAAFCVQHAMLSLRAPKRCSRRAASPYR